MISLQRKATGMGNGCGGGTILPSVEPPAAGKPARGGGAAGGGIFGREPELAAAIVEPVAAEGPGPGHPPSPPGDESPPESGGGERGGPAGGQQRSVGDGV